MQELSPPAHDMLEFATLVRLPDRDELVVLVGGNGEFDADWEVVRQGIVYMCYGLAYLQQPAETLLMQWAYDDFRREYHGEDALRFVFHRGDAFPRADVLGRCVSTGDPDQRFLKEMDVAARLRAVAYPSLSASAADGQVDAIVWLEPAVAGIVRISDNDDRMTEWMRYAVDGYLARPADLPRLAELLPAL